MLNEVSSQPCALDIPAVLREWIINRHPERKGAGLTYSTPLIKTGWLTSLHLMELILVIEQLRGSSISIEMLQPGSFNDINTIMSTFFGAESR